MVDSLSVSDVESKYPSVDGLFFLSFCFVGRNQANDHKCNRAGNAGEESTKRRQRNTKPAENHYDDAGNRSSNSSLSRAFFPQQTAEERNKAGGSEEGIECVKYIQDATSVQRQCNANNQKSNVQAKRYFGKLLFRILFLHRPNPIIQMGLFTDGDGIPLAFSLFPGNQNEQKSLKPLETKILQQFGCEKFIYCSDAGLASEDNRVLNHMGQRAFIVTQSIKKLPAEDRAWALNKTDFKRLSDDKVVDITNLTENDKEQLFYKDEPFTTKKLHQRLIITYSPKYAAYQKTIRAEQICRAEKMVANGSLKKQRKNPNDPARFVNKVAVTNEGEKAKIHYYLDTDKIAEEEMYDGLYAICTDLLDDDVADILKVSEGRWQIEDCFRTMKTDFEARPVYLTRKDRIKAHFLTCFLALLHFRLLNRSLKGTYTTSQLLHTLKDIKFADVEEQGFMPVYERHEITDDLHEACKFRTDYQFITKRNMKGIQKKSKRR